MNRLRISLSACVLVTVITSLLLTTGVAQAAPLACGGWSAVSSPNVGSGGNIFKGVAVVSDKDVLAVGAYQNSLGASQRTLVEQWNGTKWNVMPSPNNGSSSNALYAMTVISPNDIWAVGSYYSLQIDNGQTLTEHWNGTSWSVVPSPSPGFDQNSWLYAVAAVSDKDVWAAGTSVNSSGVNQTLIEEWNGTKWSIVPSPNVGAGGNILDGVAVVSANDVLVVGAYQNSVGASQRTLVEQWNGTKWSVVPSSNNGSSSNALYAMTVISPNDIWAVGSYYSLQIDNGQTLTEHWNGAKWSVVPSPNPGFDQNSWLYALTPVSVNDVWAVGTSIDSSGVYQTLIEQWNGTKWSIVSSPNVGSSTNYLYGVARIPGSSNLWAVGYYSNSGGVNQTLIEHYC